MSGSSSVSLSLVLYYSCADLHAAGSKRRKRCAKQAALIFFISQESCKTRGDVLISSLLAYITFLTLPTGNLIKPLITFRNRVISTIWPNRAADTTQLGLETHMYPFIKHLWTGSRANCWDLHSLAVAPAYQNRGYGRQLVKWGLEQAEREGVAASVLSAEGKERFYQRCGFVDVVGRATDGVGNPLAGRVRGGAILFRDPEDED